MGQHSRERTEDFHKQRLDIFCKLKVKEIMEQQNFEKLIRAGIIVREKEEDNKEKKCV